MRITKEIYKDIYVLSSTSNTIRISCVFFNFIYIYFKVDYVPFWLRTNDLQAILTAVIVIF